MTAHRPVVLFVSTEHDPDPWRAALAPLLPEMDFRTWPDTIGAAEDIEVALAWKPPAGLLATFPNLKAILSLGAGVDALLGDASLPADVPIARVVDETLTHGMTEYIVHAVLHFHRGFEQMAALQQNKTWRQLPRQITSGRRVGILGQGALGKHAARALVGLGFDVAGWSRSPKNIDGIDSFAGPDGFAPFLARTDILVCLLPLTPETTGILDAETFAHMPEGGFVINAARGDHLVDDDLLAALDSGHIAAAMLDVFRAEPLPADHPFWDHPNIIVTPHIASLTAIESAAEHLADNIRRATTGQPLRDQVDISVGY